MPEGYIAKENYEHEVRGIKSMYGWGGFFGGVFFATACIKLFGG